MHVDNFFSEWISDTTDIPLGNSITKRRCTLFASWRPLSFAAVPTLQGRFYRLHQLFVSSRGSGLTAVISYVTNGRVPGEYGRKPLTGRPRVRCFHIQRTSLQSCNDFGSLVALTLSPDALG